MYALAEHFDIRGLKDLAVQKFLAATEDHFTNPGFYDAINVVYDEGKTLDEDGGLRNVVARLICEDLTAYGMSSMAEEKLKQLPSLAMRVLKMHFNGKGCD
jgi:hypothetical protein